MGFGGGFGWVLFSLLVRWFWGWRVCDKENLPGRRSIFLDSSPFSWWTRWFERREEREVVSGQVGFVFDSVLQGSLFAAAVAFSGIVWQNE